MLEDKRPIHLLMGSLDTIRSISRQKTRVKQPSQQNGVFSVYGDALRTQECAGNIL